MKEIICSTHTLSEIPFERFKRAQYLRFCAFIDRMGTRIRGTSDEGPSRAMMISSLALYLGYFSLIFPVKLDDKVDVLTFNWGVRFRRGLEKQGEKFPEPSSSFQVPRM